MIDLHKIKLSHSPLTDSIFLFRHGVNERVALDKRNAEADVFAVLIEYMMHNAPNGSVRVVALDGKKYTIKVTPND